MVIDGEEDIFYMKKLSSSLSHPTEILCVQRKGKGKDGKKYEKGAKTTIASFRFA